MNRPSPGFLTKHAKLSRNLQVIATATKDAIRRAMGKEEAANISFSLFVWHNDPASQGGWLSYIGTAERGDIIPQLELMIERWKRGDPDVPLHERH